MLKRVIEAKLDKWVKDSKKALIVTGARQVGKTFSIRECLKKNQCDYVEINLIDKPEMLSVLEHCESVDDLIVNTTAVMDHELKPGSTIFLSMKYNFLRIS